MAGKGLVVAKEAIVIVVGASPPEYHKADVTNQRTGELHKDLPLTEVSPKEPGDDGVPYAFKAFQKVNRNHPAVKANPGAFVDMDSLEEADLELVNG